MGRQRGAVPKTAGMLALLLTTSCGASDGLAGPASPLHLAVTVRVDSTTFRADGEFDLELIPSYLTGTSHVLDPWEVAVALSAPDQDSAEGLATRVAPADSAPVAVAMLLDNSGSMRFSDPDRVRASAARLFWRAVLPSRPGNMVALLEFGRGGAEPTPGFTRVALLADFTTNEAVLDAAAAGIQAVPGAGTPLYGAALETVRWMDSTAPPSHARTLVVITDGTPSDGGVAQELYDGAVASGIRVFPIGVGPAAEEFPPSEPALRLQELASQTGGIYGGADPIEELHGVLQMLARSASPAYLLVRLRITEVPLPGTRVAGTVWIWGSAGTASADWSFVAP